jgi:hypothetical protein
VNLTKKMAIKLHRELWGWVYNEALKKNMIVSKSSWPKWRMNGGKYSKIVSDCFLCEYAMNRFKKLNLTQLYLTQLYCNYCPLNWKITKTCDHPYSYYCRWIEDSSLIWAKKIRDLEERFYGRNKKKL